MPYSLSENKLCVLDADGKEMKCYQTSEEAKKYLAALEINVKEAHTEKIAFEPFRVLDTTKPFPILPLGKFYRGGRVLDIDRARLDDIAKNFAAGLPRYGVKVNVEHGNDASQPGKVGVVKEIRNVPGKGLYATKVELTEAGRKLLEEDRYDAPSPEMVWTLNDGAQYQDPETGDSFDNVLVGLALTNSPFFGSHVSVFSAKEGYMDPALQNIPQDMDGDCDNPEAQAHKLIATISQLDDLSDDLQTLAGVGEPIDAAKQQVKLALTKLLELFTPGQPETLKEKFDAPDSSDVHIDGGVKMAHADFPNHHNADGSPDPEKIKSQLAKLRDSKDLTAEEKTYMTHLDTHGAPEKAAAGVTVEQFAVVTAQAEQFKAQAEQAQTKLNQLAEQFAVERNLRRAGEFEDKAEDFSALPITAPVLGAQLMWLEDADATADKSHVKYFTDLLTSLNKAMGQSTLFSAFGSERAAENTSQPAFLQAVERIRKEQFSTLAYSKGFTEAWKQAEVTEKDLALQYAQERKIQ